MNRPNEERFYVEAIEDGKTEITFDTTNRELIYERFTDNLKGKYILGYAGMGKVTRTNHYNGYCEYVFNLKGYGNDARKWRYHFIVKEQ